MKLANCLIFASILFGTLDLYAKCSIMSSCTLVDEAKSEFSFVLSLRYFAKTCRFSATDAVTKKVWTANLVGCPKVLSPSYILIIPSCDKDTLPRHSDRILINTEQECKTILARRAEKFKEISEIVKPGMKVSDLKLFGFARSMPQFYRENVWLYRTSSKFEIEIEVTQERCENQICQDDSKQKIAHLLEIRDLNTDPNWKD